MEIKKGDIIKKKSGMLFSTQEPTMIVYNVIPTKKDGLVVINGFLCTNVSDIEVIDVDEYEDLKAKYAKIILSPTDGLTGINDPCVSSVTNEPKVKYRPDADNWKQALWRMKFVRRVEEADSFQAYLCPKCKFIHIGRTLRKTDFDQAPQ